MRHDVKEVADRRGNWVQTFESDDDARLFATAQFRRHRELLETHLARLAAEKTKTKLRRGKR
jgi:hypothetical protein